jgi:hypothetical protein
MHEAAIRSMADCLSGGEARYKAIRKLGINLTQARTIRTTADYHLHQDFDRSSAEDAVRIGAKILAEVPAVPDPKKRT